MLKKGFEEAKENYTYTIKILSQVVQSSMEAMIDAAAKAEPSWERLKNYLPDNVFPSQPFAVTQAQMIAVMEHSMRFWETSSQRLNSTSSPDEFVRELKALMEEIQRV